jgi:hypothetical protein
VEGQVEGDRAEPAGDGGIIEEMAELAAVVAGRVQAEQRNPGAGLLHENPVRFAGNVDAGIAAGDRFEVRHPASPFRA